MMFKAWIVKMGRSTLRGVDGLPVFFGTKAQAQVVADGQDDARVVKVSVKVSEL